MSDSLCDWYAHHIKFYHISCIDELPACLLIWLVRTHRIHLAGDRSIQHLTSSCLVYIATNKLTNCKSLLILGRGQDNRFIFAKYCFIHRKDFTLVKRYVLRDFYST
jgi:hypothetical protein